MVGVPTVESDGLTVLVLPVRAYRPKLGVVAYSWSIEEGAAMHHSLSCVVSP